MVRKHHEVMSQSETMAKLNFAMPENKEPAAAGFIPEWFAMATVILAVALAVLAVK
jgi:hypothetical protein